MPSAYPGNPTPATATLRANSTVYALNALAHPNPPTGLYYKATTGGTSGAAPPTWSTAELIGQTVTDGTVVWTCMGSCVGPGVAPILQEPVDSDAPTSSTVDIPFSTLADFIAFLQKWAALVNESNEFTVPQIFDFQSVTDTTFGLESAPAGVTVRKGLWSGVISGTGSAFMAWYADGAPPAPNHLAITLALNVLWNGTNWAIQASGDDCLKVVFGDEGISVWWHTGTGPSTFADSAWTQLLVVGPPTATGAGLTILNALAATQGTLGGPTAVGTPTLPNFSSATVEAGASDTAGTVDIVTTTSTPGAGQYSIAIIETVNGKNPNSVVLTPANSTAAAFIQGAGQVYAEKSHATGEWAIWVNAGAGSFGGGTMKFNYVAIF